MAETDSTASVSFFIVLKNIDFFFFRNASYVIALISASNLQFDRVFLFF